MRKIYFLLVMVVIGLSGFSQTTIAEQDFDAGTSMTYTNTLGSTQTGSSGAGDRPASSTFYSNGSTAWKAVNQSSVVTFSNVTGLSAYTSKYFEFRLAAWSISSTGNGVDGTDIVTVAISLDGGTTYSSELRVLGNTNAFWHYSTGTGIASVTYDGNNTPTDFAPAGGGARTADGYSTIRVNLDNSVTQARIRITLLNNSVNEYWTIDEVKLIGTLAPTGTSTITAGPASEPASISSLINTQGAASVNFDFTIQDDGATPATDVLATQISQIVLNAGTGNAVTNWTTAIAGVELSDGTNTTTTATIGASSITFAGISNAVGELGHVADDASKTYTLKIWLNTNLGALATTIDGSDFVFRIQGTGVTATGSQFASGQDVNSGDGNNVVSVAATVLSFVQNTTSPTALNAAMTPAPTVSANDANGNRDLDFVTNVDITSTGTLQGSPVSVAAISGLATFTGNIIHTVAGTGQQLTAASAGLTSGTSNLFDIQVASSATDYFRSAVATGNWNDVGSWQSSPDNSTWNPSTLVPDANANIITIRNGHNITIATAAGGDQVVVEAGGTLTLNAAFTLADGTGTDLDVSGTVVNTSGTHVITGTVVFGANSLYQHNRNGSAVLTATWNVTSTAEITGVITSQPTGLGQTFGNFTWNCPSQSSNIGLGNPAGFAIAGNLTVTNTGGFSGRALRFTSGTPYTLTVGGNLTLNGGHLGLSSGTGTMALTVAGNVSISNSSELYLSQAGSALGTLNIGGDLSINNATLTETGSANGIVIFNKNGTQSFSASSATISNIVNYSITNTSTLLVNSGFPVNTGAILTVDGTLIAAATVTNNGTTNINNIFQLNDGGWGTGTGFVYGPAATLVFNTTTNYGVNNDAYWPSSNGPVNVTVQNTGGITMNVARTVTGLFQTAAGVLNGNNLTLNGTAQINAGGYFTNAPVYGPASLLRYNTGGTYNRGDEWNATGVGTIGTTNGYPNDVQVSNNTTINLPNGSAVDRACARDLIIDNGSALYADYGGGSVKLFVGRNFDMSGNVSLGSIIGGDMYVRGNFTRNAGTFNPNGRTVFFDGPSGDQTITGVTTFDYIEVNKAANNVVLANNIICNLGLTLASGKIVLGSNDITLLNASPSALNASSSSSYVVTNGTGAFRRAIGTLHVGQDYFLPVGNASNRQNVAVNFVTISANNTLAARFISGSPAGTAGLPLSENGNNISRAANNGYWEVTAASSTTDNYTGTFSANGFTDITDYTRLHLIKRADAVSNWGLDGTHITTTGSNLAAVLQRTGMSGFSQFAVGGQSNLSLPVTLLSFSGYKDGSRNQLSWTTGTEINNRGFDVQRSADGINYTSIGFVNSLATGGNSNDQLSYRFTDNTPA